MESKIIKILVWSFILVVFALFLSVLALRMAWQYRIASYQEFYPDGQPKMLIQQAPFAKEGVYILYYANGRVHFSGSYHNGKLQGPVVWYYSNGNIQMQGIAEGGAPQGYFQIHDIDGYTRLAGQLTPQGCKGVWTGYNTFLRVDQRIDFQKPIQFKKCVELLTSKR